MRVFVRTCLAGQVVLATCGAFGHDASAPLRPTRMTAGEVAAQPTLGAIAVTSGLEGIRTVVLAGDPTHVGLYTIELRVPAHTRIEAHEHRDNRTAVVVSGTWHFGYGRTAKDSKTRALPAGSFYTEPANVPHFARTGAEPVAVIITGNGPTDTRYIQRSDQGHTDPKEQP